MCTYFVKSLELEGLLEVWYHFNPICTVPKEGCRAVTQYHAKPYFDKIIHNNLVDLLKGKYSEPFNCHESLLWEGFVTPIYAGSRPHRFSILHSENRKLNGSGEIFAFGMISRYT